MKRRELSKNIIKWGKSDLEYKKANKSIYQLKNKYSNYFKKRNILAIYPEINSGGICLRMLVKPKVGKILEKQIPDNWQGFKIFYTEKIIRARNT